MFVGVRKHEDGEFYWEDCTKVNIDEGTLNCVHTKLTKVAPEMWYVGQPNNWKGKQINANIGGRYDLLSDCDSNDADKYMCEYKLY